ncbi:unnamed protein product [Linum tenue]|nr:unnamed protein product [Linum tenue]
MVGEYAWGAGALAYLYRQLGIASRAEAKGVAGCLTLLQCWIYGHFPTLRPSRLEPRELERGQEHSGGTVQHPGRVRRGMHRCWFIIGRRLIV